ncbi:MAG: hypothetical protein IJ890_02255 [Clostridia bacterium]|nr:hypothetical protein [Clostridia bacterium]
MNQILVTNEENGAKSREIRPIIIFFCVVCIIFALILIGEGAYYLYKNKGKNQNYPKPEMSYEENGSSLNLRINGEKGINKVTYSWNGGSENVYEANGKRNVDFDIEMPQGENKLAVKVTDVEGNETKYDNVSVSFTATEDTTKPVITIENANGKLVVTAMDETELDYFSYQWEGSDVVKVNPEEDKKLIKQEINVEQGTKRISLVATDKSGNQAKLSKKIIGSNGPEISASLADGNFVVKVKDELGITKIEYTHNEEVSTVNNLPEGAKEFEFKVPLKEGANYLKVNAYENGIMTEYKCKKTK